MAEQLVSFLQRTPSPDTSLKRALASSALFFGSLTSLNYFRLSFRNCKSCVYNCDDLLSFKKSSLFGHTILNPLLTKFVRSRWLD